MKRLTLLLVIFMVTATGLSLRAENIPSPSMKPQDTIFIKLPNGAGMNLIVKNTAQLKAFKEYKLDSLMTLLSGYVDQVEKMGKSTSKENAKDVTVTFYPAKDLKNSNAPEEIQITVLAGNQKNNANGKNNGLEEVIKIFIEYKEKKRQASHSEKDSVKAEA
ncbi:MAG: hypothetical protein JWQ14_1610, partial [Adhaeribacter sp.]|nr:hypothetical protein [Adhaeribacter sp.]